MPFCGSNCRWAFYEKKWTCVYFHIFHITLFKISEHYKVIQIPEAFFSTQGEIEKTRHLYMIKFTIPRSKDHGVDHSHLYINFTLC